MKLTEDEKGTLKLARAFEPLRKSEGWHYLKQILEARRDSHMKAVMSPNLDERTAYAAERDKGAYAALMFVLSLLDITCEEAEKIRKDRGEDPDGD